MKNQLYLFLCFALFPLVNFAQFESNKTVYFETDSSNLSSASIHVLDSIAKVMSNKKQFSISLKGHTDNVGSNEYNQNLSKNRVLAVRNYLLSKGIGDDKIRAEEYGENAPVAENKSAINRALNRRVEIQISEMLEPIVPQKVGKEEDGDPAIIMVRYGIDTYTMPDQKRKIEINAVVNTDAMESSNFSTVTTDNEPLMSSLMFSIKPAKGTNCDLGGPISLYFPVNENMYRKIEELNYYEAVEDSLGSGRLKWKKVEPNYTIKKVNGTDYFVVVIMNACNSGINFDWCMPSDQLLTETVQLKSRRSIIQSGNLIHKLANSLIPGEKIKRNVYQFASYNFQQLESPTVKLTILKNRRKEYTLSVKLSDLKRNKEGHYIITKKKYRKNRQKVK